ncbi:unnamed protein product [Chrysoparadoxa australica]
MPLTSSGPASQPPVAVAASAFQRSNSPVPRSAVPTCIKVKGAKVEDFRNFAQRGTSLGHPPTGSEAEHRNGLEEQDHSTLSDDIASHAFSDSSDGESFEGFDFGAGQGEQGVLEGQGGGEIKVDLPHRHQRGETERGLGQDRKALREEAKEEATDEAGAVQAALAHQLQQQQQLREREEALRQKERSLEQQMRQLQLEREKHLEHQQQQQQQQLSLSQHSQPPHLRHAPSHSSFSNEVQSEGTSMTLYIPKLLAEGGFLWKMPFHQAGRPKRRWFQLKPAGGLPITRKGKLDLPRRARKQHHEHHDAVDYASMVEVDLALPLTIIWLDPDRSVRKTPPREMLLEEVSEVTWGHKTTAFWQQAAYRGMSNLPAPELCFSLVEQERTLDLAAATPTEAQAWQETLMMLITTSAGRRREAHAHRGLSHTSTLLAGSQNWQSHIERPIRSASGSSLQYEGGLKPMSRRESAASASTRETWGSTGEEYAERIDLWHQGLFMAARQDYAGRVRDLFRSGCPPDLMEAGSGDTALLAACRLGHVEVVKECLDAGARNDPHPDFGQTALQAAVAGGHYMSVRLMLQTAALTKADEVIVNHGDPNRESPLHVAARQGNLPMVELLLSHGASIHLVDRRGCMPLHTAASKGKHEVLTAMLQAGGDVFMEEAENRGNRPLHLAAEKGHTMCVRVLLEYAAVPGAVNFDMQTPMTLARARGQRDCVRLLEEYGGSRATPGTQLGHTSVGELPRPRFSSHASVRRRDSEPIDSRQLPVQQLQRSSAFSSHPDGTQTARHSHSQAKGQAQTFWPTEPVTPMQQQQQQPHEQQQLRHGSLFDGLDVYVVGGRQPLGQSVQSVDQSVSQPFNQSVSPSTGQRLSSSAHGAPMLRLQRPSWESSGASPAPSARAQARMMFFGSGGGAPSPMSTSLGGSSSRGLDSDRTSTSARLAWGEEAVGGGEGSEESFYHGQELWYVSYEGGYPYFTCEDTGASQWEDPRVDPSEYDSNGYRREQTQQQSVHQPEQQKVQVKLSGHPLVPKLALPRPTDAQRIDEASCSGSSQGASEVSPASTLAQEADD